MASVYIHINKINDKKYVGYSKYDDPELRWGTEGSNYKGQKFYNEGISSFGWNNFTHKILIKDIPITLAKTLESILIEKLHLIENGYNEDKGILYKDDEKVAFSMIDNLLKIIKEEKENDFSLKKLEDVLPIKYRATTVNYRLEYLYNLFNSGRINTNLDCQRGYVWSEEYQQGMWDTLLYGHRIPEIHAIRKPNGTYDIIDGKQRTLTLMKILNNEIPLKRKYASDEIKKFMVNNKIFNLYFKDLSETLQNRFYDKELSVAEYFNVDDSMMVILFQKLNASKPLSSFQKAVANNYIIRLRYIDYFYNNNFIKKMFSEAELKNGEDEIFLVRLLSVLNCGDIKNVDDLAQRNLELIIQRVDTNVLIRTRDTIYNILNEFQELKILPEDFSNINKPWYPVVFKFFNENITKDLKPCFKEFLSYIKIPPQRGEDSTKSDTKNRYNSVLKDWDNFCKNKKIDKHISSQDSSIKQKLDKLIFI